MSWEDQGRQYHMWFGHGSSDNTLQPPPRQHGPDEAVATVAQLAAKRLPPARRIEFNAMAANGGVDRVVKAASLWAAASHLPPPDFQRLVVGDTMPQAGAAALQAMGRSLDAATQAGANDPAAAAGALDAAAQHLATALQTTPRGEMNYAISWAASQARYASVNGQIPDDPAAAAAPDVIPSMTIHPGGDGNQPGTPDVPTIVAGLLTIAETLGTAALLEMLPVLLAGLGTLLAAKVIAELVRRLAEQPGRDGPETVEPAPALPPNPGLVPPPLPLPVLGTQPPAPPPAAAPAGPGFTPSPPLPHTTTTPAPDGPTGPNVSPMARPKATPEEVERRKAKLRAAGLPTEGPYPYIPPRTWTSPQPIPRGKNRGYLDRHGAEWLWPKGNKMRGGKPDHWDVNGPGDKHRNVTLQGTKHHGK